jgi:hypothetical protein
VRYYAAEKSGSVMMIFSIDEKLRYLYGIFNYAFYMRALYLPQQQSSVGCVLL